MTDPEITVYVRNSSLQRVAQVDDYTDLEVTARHNAVGSWVLTLDRRLDAAIALTAPNAGIEILAGDATVITGPATNPKIEQSEQTNRATIAGVSDDVWLARRLAYPQPSTGPPYNAYEYDVRTGVASTVMGQYVEYNAGPSAIGPRQVPGLTVGTDPVLGGTGTWRARWQPLPELLTEIATWAGLGYQTTQSGTSLVFGVYEPVDRSGSVRFDAELGTLSAAAYEVTVPESTYVIVGGDGDGTARITREVFDADQQATWGRIEAFRDRPGTTDTAELDQAGAEQLTEDAEKTSLSLTPLDTDQQRYGQHYTLGDRVSAVVAGVVVVDVVREITLKVTADERTVTPLIGTPGALGGLRLFADVRDAVSRIRRLERR